MGVLGSACCMLACVAHTVALLPCSEVGGTLFEQRQMHDWPRAMLMRWRISREDLELVHLLSLALIEVKAVMLAVGLECVLVLC